MIEFILGAWHVEQGAAASFAVVGAPGVKFRLVRRTATQQFLLDFSVEDKLGITKLFGGKNRPKDNVVTVSCRQKLQGVSLTCETINKQFVLKVEGVVPAGVMLTVTYSRLHTFGPDRTFTA